MAKACKALGLDLVLGQQTFKWVGRWYDDYSEKDAAHRNGINPKDYGKCVHAIKQVTHKGSGFEIGLIAQQDGDGFRLIFDFVDYELVQKVGGKSCERLVQEYSLAVIEETPEVEALKLQGWSLERQPQANGDVQLILQK